MLSVLFRKLRLVYDKCNENCAGLDPIPPEVRHGHCVERLILCFTLGVKFSPRQEGTHVMTLTNNHLPQ